MLTVRINACWKTESAGIKEIQYESISKYSGTQWRHCFYFVNQSESKLLGTAGFMGEIQGSADLERQLRFSVSRCPIDMAKHVTACQNPATLVHIQTKLWDTWCVLAMVTISRGLPSSFLPRTPGYQEQLWYRWLPPGLFSWSPIDPYWG